MGPNPEPEKNFWTKTQETLKPTNIAVAVLKQLVKDGKHKRAIVCHKTKDHIDPMNWGIVVDIQAQRGYPMEIMWATGPRQWSDGSDVDVIYRSMNQKDMATFLEMTERSKNEAH